MGLAPSSPPIGRQRPTLGTTVAPARHYPQPGFSGCHPQIPDRAVGVPARHRVSFTASQRGGTARSNAPARGGRSCRWASATMGVPTTIVCIPNGVTCTVARSRTPVCVYRGLSLGRSAVSQRWAGIASANQRAAQYHPAHVVTGRGSPQEHRSTSNPCVDFGGIYDAASASERAACRAEEAARRRAEGAEASATGA